MGLGLEDIGRFSQKAQAQILQKVQESGESGGGCKSQGGETEEGQQAPRGEGGHDYAGRYAHAL